MTNSKLKRKDDDNNRLKQVAHVYTKKRIKDIFSLHRGQIKMITKE